MHSERGEGDRWEAGRSSTSQVKRCFSGGARLGCAGSTDSASRPRCSRIRLDPIPNLAQRAGRGLLRRIGLHPEDPERASMHFHGARALVIASSHGVLDIGVATGVFASELTVPYYVLLDAGLSVDVASIQGGVVPIDPLSMKPAIRAVDDDRMLADPRLRGKLTNSHAVGDTDFAAYDIVFLAGGWGAAFDFGQSDALAHRMGEAYAADRILGGICHGPLGLLRARRPDGELIVRGRRLTAVTDRQIRQLGVSLTPLHPETALRAAGATFESRTHAYRDFFANHYVADGDLITGQNQNSGPMVARLMLERARSEAGRYPLPLTMKDRRTSMSNRSPFRRAALAIDILALASAVAAVCFSTTVQRAIFESAAARMAASPNTAPLHDDALRVAVCGTSAPLPSRDGAKACVAVFAGGKYYVVDAGPESTENLVLWGIPLSEIGGVLLTHFHSDHIGELGELQEALALSEQAARLMRGRFKELSEVLAALKEDNPDSRVALAARLFERWPPDFCRAQNCPYDCDAVASAAFAEIRRARQTSVASERAK